MDSITLSAQTRTITGKKTRALRRDGQVPLHLYGLTVEPASLQAPTSDVREVLHAAGFTTPVTVKVEGGEEAIALVRDIARHPVTGDIQHIDLLRVDPDKPIEARVPVTLINMNTAPGIRGGAGVVTQGLYDVLVKARPFDVPKQLVADCNLLVTATSALRISELDYPEGVHPAGNVTKPVVWIQAPRVTKVEEPVAGEEAAVAGTAGAAPATGAATPAAGAAAAGAAAPARR